jgi:WD40 repeat protein
MASHDMYVRVAPSPRLKSTQSTASVELVQVRVQHILPHSTQRARMRVGKLKKTFTMPTDVMLRDHAAAQAATLQRLHLVKSVRNVRVQSGAVEGGGVAGGALCLPFQSCAALPPLASSARAVVASTSLPAAAAAVDDDDDNNVAAVPLSCVLTGSVDGLLTLWDAEQCTPLCSHSTYPQGHSWGRVKSIEIYPSSVPSSAAETTTTKAVAAEQCFAFTVSMFQNEVRVWRIAGMEHQHHHDAEKEEKEVEAESRARHVHARQAHTRPPSFPSPSLQPLTVACVSDAAATSAASPSSPVGGLQQVAVDPTGALLAATHSSGVVHVWDVRSVVNGGGVGAAAAGASTTTPLQHLFTQDGYETAGAVLGVAFHPDGSLLTTCDAGGRVVAWDTRSGQLAFHTGGRVGGHLRSALCVAWSPCGVRFASGGADGVVHLYDARQLTKAGVGPHNDAVSGAAPFQLLGHDDAVTSVSFYANPLLSPSADASVLPLGLVTTSLDHTLRVWDADTGLCVRALDAGMPLYDHCRPALLPLSSRFVTSTAVLAVGHGKSWLQYDVGLRGEVQEDAEGGGVHRLADERVTVKENDVVATANGAAGGMTLAVGTAAVGRGSGSSHEEDRESDDDEEDEMLALLKAKVNSTAAGTTAVSSAGCTAREEEDPESGSDSDSDDEMEMLRKK